MQTRVRKMSPFGWLTLRGFMKFKIFFVKSEYEGKLQISFGSIHITLMEKKE